MAWFEVDFLSEDHKGVVGTRVCLSLEGVAPELCEECTFGDEARCFEWAAVRD